MQKLSDTIADYGASIHDAAPYDVAWRLRVTAYNSLVRLLAPLFWLGDAVPPPAIF